MTEANRLAPCPFCGARSTAVEMDICCSLAGGGCGAITRFPIASIRSHAARLWNARAIPQEPWRPIATAPKYETILGWWRNGEQHTGSTDGARWFPAWDNQDRNWSMPTLWRSLSDPNESSAPVALSSLPSGESDPSVMPDSAGAGPSSDGGVEGHAVSSALSGRTSSGHMAAVQGVCSLEETPLRTEAGIKPGPSNPIAQGQREALENRVMELIARFHRSSCYPNAMSYELKAVADAILATLPQPSVGACREALEETFRALREIKRVVEESGKLNGREYVGLGIRVNNALDRAERALAPSAQEGECPQCKGTGRELHFCEQGFKHEDRPCRACSVTRPNRGGVA